MTEYTNLCTNSRFDGTLRVGAAWRSMWNNSNTVISNNGRTVTRSGAASGSAIGLHRVLAGDGKVWFSITYDGVLTVSNNHGFGITSAVGSVAGADLQSFCFVTDDYQLQFNQPSSSTAGTNPKASNAAWAVGDVFDVVFQPPATSGGTGKVWARCNGGAWNPNLGGAQDPATDDGGIALSGMTGSSFFPFVRLPNLNDQVTFDFDGTPPSGASRFPANDLGIAGWEFMWEPLKTNVILESWTTWQGRTELTLRTYFYDVPPSVGWNSGIMSKPVEVGTGAYVTFCAVHARYIGSLGNRNRHMASYECDDASRTNAQVLQSINNVSSIAASATSYTPAYGGAGNPTPGVNTTKPFVYFVYATGGGTSVVAGSTSYSFAIIGPQLVADPSIYAWTQPYVETWDLQTRTMNWERFTASAALTVGGGGISDPPSGTTALWIEAFSGGGMSGASTSSFGGAGGGGGQYALARNVAVTDTTGINFTLTGRNVTPDTDSADVSVTVGGVEKARAAGGKSGVGQTGGAARAQADGLGDVVFPSTAGGSGTTAAGAGGGAGPSRWATGGNGSNAAGIAATAALGGVVGGTGRSTGNNQNADALSPGAGAGGPGANGTSNGFGSGLPEVWVGWYVSSGASASGVGAAMAAAVANGNGAAQAVADGAAVAASSVAAVGAAEVRASGVPAGVATAAAEGRVEARAVGSASGTSSAGAGSATDVSGGGAGASSGTTLAAAVGAAQARVSGASSGAATADATSRVSIGGSGAAQGGSTASGGGAWITESVTPDDRVTHVAADDRSVAVSASSRAMAVSVEERRAA